MRRKIAVFANGWGGEYLKEIGNGIYRYAVENDIDVFAFVNHSAYMEEESENNGEFNIFTLPELSDFDGAIYLANSFNLQREAAYLEDKLLKAGIPAVSLEQEMKGAHYLGANNYTGMHELAEHLVKEHQVKEILFIGGFREHNECQIRLQAVCDVLKENGLKIKEENILFADWSAEQAGIVFSDWLSENGRMPDAIMCANDVMAIGICKWLDSHGYRVPNEVIVTGFDNLKESREFLVPISTVTRDWDSMGYAAAQMLFAEREEGAALEHRVIETKMVLGESCGCKGEALVYDSAEKRALLVKPDGFGSDKHFRHMYAYIRKDETAGEFNRDLSSFFADENWMEGNNFMMCLRPDFFSLEGQEDDLRKEGYPKTMDIICSLYNGSPRSLLRMKTREAMFMTSSKMMIPGTYIFVPLHSEDSNLGFAMFTRDFEIADINQLYIWTRHMNQNLEQVRSNVKIAELTRRLHELSITDGLTGTYNRNGCEKILYPMMEECQRSGGQGMLIIADVDHMKTINDKYGHTSGDVALCTIADVLKAELPEGFHVARFGGDEFLIVGKYDGIVTIERIAANIMRCLAEEVKKRGIQFELTVSVGGTILKRGETFDLVDSLQKADVNMYKMKKIHHEESSSPAENA